MIILNLTISVPREKLSAWKQWWLTEQIPSIMNRELFTSYRVSRLITDAEEHTYTTQLTCASLSELKRFLDIGYTELQASQKAAFGDEVVLFKSVMRLVEEGA